MAEAVVETAHTLARVLSANKLPDMPYQKYLCIPGFLTHKKGISSLH